MIYISRTGNGILVQRDSDEVFIDDRAIRACLGTIISELVSDGRALAAARKDAYEAGLTQGYANAEIAHETRERIADRQATELVEALIGCELASAA